MAEDSDSDDAQFMGVNPPPDEVQLIVPPTGPSSADAQFLSTDVYQAALAIFSGKKFNCPTIPTMRSLLDPFLSQPATGFFKAASVLAKRFDKLKNNTKSVFKSARAKTELWVKPYIAPRLSLLLSLRELRLNEQASEAAAASTSTETPLQRAFTQLYDVFAPCYSSYLANEENEKNKKHRTPTLQLHTNDARPHEHFQWNVNKRIQCPCPICAHVSTLLFQPAAAAGGGSIADLMGADRIAAANAMSTSANTGCFCFRINCHGKQDGSGCYLCEAKAKEMAPPISTKPGLCMWGCAVCACHCSCTFSDKHRMTIAMGWKKTKEKESKRLQEELGAVESQAESTLLNRLDDLISGGGTGVASRHHNISLSASDSGDEDRDPNASEDDEEDDSDDGFYQKQKRSKKRKTDAVYSKASLELLHSGENLSCSILPVYISDIIC